MTLSQLETHIKEYNIPERWYSIDQGLKPDCLVLYKNYSVWEYFYYDEKGNRQDFASFIDEGDAYEHLWMKLEQQHKFFNRQV